ncbi:diguanylate cyclase domain-containing protein [Kineococcus esterisolvens]|uniref:diguanylate cyclase domain-containing protein n=1 Tax=unclassified Kineococcus TaxID=2621656 RepID=UPI003D7EE54E
MDPAREHDALLAVLLELTARPATPADVLALALAHLGPCGAVVGASVRASGESGTDEVRAGAATGTGELLAPLRLGGEVLGELTLVTGDGPAPPPHVVAVLAHHVAVVAGTRALQRERAFDATAADAVRRLFEEGVRATSVGQAARLLARVTADVFGTERAAVHVTDADGVIRTVYGVGVPDAVAAELERSLVGRRADASPVWRRAEHELGPVLSGDASRDPRRTGGFAQVMGLRSYAAMPLLSVTGPVGMAVCGDVSRTRAWTAREREVARRLALQGALVVDSARMRQVERAHLDEVTALAHTDALTGLANRRVLLDALAGACGGDDPAALLLVDLDGFKHVNDTLGHQAGDVLLQQVASRLRAVVPAPGLVARLGGDEFAVLLRGGPGRALDAGAARAVARRLERVVAEPVRVEGAEARVGASIGVAPLPGGAGAAAVPGVLRAADEAMYRSKRARAGRVPAGAPAAG